jgi:hypothetical protein
MVVGIVNFEIIEGITIFQACFLRRLADPDIVCYQSAALAMHIPKGLKIMYLVYLNSDKTIHSIFTDKIQTLDVIVVDARTLLLDNQQIPVRSVSPFELAKLRAAIEKANNPPIPPIPRHDQS